MTANHFVFGETVQQIERRSCEVLGASGRNRSTLTRSSPIILPNSKQVEAGISHLVRSLADYGSFEAAPVWLERDYAAYCHKRSRALAREEAFSSALEPTQ